VVATAVYLAIDVQALAGLGPLPVTVATGDGTIDIGMAQ
jgi:hypothetical protein